MIEFKVLAIKTETNDTYTIFLLKNVRDNIIKILGYLSIAILTSLKKWKIAITSVRQEYKFTKNRQDYKIRLIKKE